MRQNHWRKESFQRSRPIDRCLELVLPSFAYEDEHSSAGNSGVDVERLTILSLHFIFERMKRAGEIRDKRGLR